jgi:hypothetical protein
VRTSKRAKVDEGEFPWIIQESLSGMELSDDLKKTLDLLRTYAKDLKFTKSSILTSPHAPQFPNSEWTNVIIGAMVDLDHVISGSFAVSNDNWDVEVVGGIQFKFGAARASKHVKTSGDWFIVWDMYAKAVMFAFPHRQHELQVYGQHILGLSPPPQSDTTLTFSCLTKLCKSELENNATSFSQTLRILTTYTSIGSTRSGREIPARPKPKLISGVRSLATDGTEGCVVRNLPSASTSTCKECSGKHRAEDCKRSETGGV